jgi:hypothetical protein
MTAFGHLKRRIGSMSYHLRRLNWTGIGNEERDKRRKTFRSGQGGLGGLALPRCRAAEFSKEDVSLQSVSTLRWLLFGAIFTRAD